MPTSIPLIQSLVIGINIYTPHVDYHSYEYNTPGIYAHINNSLLVGIVRNSYRNPTIYLARTWNPFPGAREFTIITGGAYGYEYAPIVPLVSIGWKFDSGFRAQFLPGMSEKSTSITFSYEWTMK